MSKIDDQTRLRHMRDAAVEATRFAQGRSRESLNTDRMLALSLVKLVEIMGEAASRVSQETRSQLPRIPWVQIISMRNRLTHAYFDIDLDIVWKTATEDLVLLIAELERVVEK